MHRWQQSRRRRPVRILVVHGSPAVRDEFARLLACCPGARAAVVSTVSVSRKPAAFRRLDLIFLSQRLRGQSVALLLELKRRSPHAFVVIVANRSGAPAEMMKFLAAGAGLFLGRDQIGMQVPAIVHFLQRTAPARTSGRPRLRSRRASRERVS